MHPTGSADRASGRLAAPRRRSRSFRARGYGEHPPRKGPTGQPRAERSAALGSGRSQGVALRLRRIVLFVPACGGCRSDCDINRWCRFALPPANGYQASGLSDRGAFTVGDWRSAVGNCFTALPFGAEQTTLVTICDERQVPITAQLQDLRLQLLDLPRASRSPATSPCSRPRPPARRPDNVAAATPNPLASPRRSFSPSHRKTV